MSNEQGPVAVITGAASGIGRGLAEHAATLGMRLVLADRDAAGLQALCDRIDRPVVCRRLPASPMSVM